MSFWEYKVISSGKGGFATPALLEKFLNDLGRDSWEIIEFRSSTDNALAFSGLARRSTQRDWTLEDAAAAAAKVEAEKLRAEFEAKFKAATTQGSGAGGGEERAPSFLEEKAAPDDGFRKLVDTSHDDEPEAAEEEKDDWDKLTAAEEDDLPSFFDAIKPHMRRNQRGPGMSVGVDYLAKKWDQSEEDLKGALVECGFVVPEDEDSKVEHLEYDGDLYWLNINRRGELWINTKEKPRPVFKAVKAQRVVIEEEPKPDGQNQNQNRGQRDRDRNRDRDQKPAEGTPAGQDDAPAVEAGAPTPEGGAQEGGKPPASAGAPLPQGADLLQKIRPHMRRNRRGPGGSGSTTFLSRALRTNEADLKTAFAALGLTIPAGPNDKPVYTEVGNEFWWLNLDSRGGLWINGREKRPGETAAGASKDEAAASDTAGSGAESGGAPAATLAPGEVAPAAPVSTETPPASAAPAESETHSPVGESATRSPFGESDTRSPFGAPAAPPAPATADASVLTPIRALLKETRSGVGGRIDRLAEELGQTPEALTATLVSAGLKVPEKAREKSVAVEFGGELLSFSLNAKGELWLNAKDAKASDEGGDEKKSRRPRGRSKKSEDTVEETPAE